MEEAFVDLGIESFELLLDRMELGCDGVWARRHPCPEVHLRKQPAHAQDRG
jgi:hypothetical protein